jgi:hypothetical protein
LYGKKKRRCCILEQYADVNRVKERKKESGIIVLVLFCPLHL